MNYFFLRLLPPRRTFPGDMTAAEATAMQQHVVYWTGLLEKGKVIVYGPVADPRGTYGIAVVQAEREADVKEWAANDPVIKAGLGFKSEMHPMPSAVARLHHP